MTQTNTCYEKLLAHWREDNPVKSDVTKPEDLCGSCRNPLVQHYGWDDVLCERKTISP